MSELVLTARQSWNRSLDILRRRVTWVGGIALLVLSLAGQSPEVREIVLTTLADAYIQVSAFVAATLALFYALERLFRVDAGALLARHARWQVPVAAFLGALPGCGGAIVVVTQYVRGHVSFGALLAVLTATMGDAAFLLLAQEPATGAAVFVLGMAVGTVTGWFVDAVHGTDFLRQGRNGPGRGQVPAVPEQSFTRRLNPLWVALAVPGFGLAVLAAFQVDSDALFATALVPHPTLWIGVAGSLLAIAMWTLSPGASLAANVNAEDAEEASPHTAAGGSTLDRVIGDTNFVTAWVVFAFLIYELGLYATGIDLQALFAVWAPVVPLIAVLVGLLPGCGPQVVVTTLYLNGVVPLSAQLGNAISNDGDALFPAIALAPRAATLATLYSTVPALIVGYGYWWFWG